MPGNHFDSGHLRYNNTLQSKSLILLRIDPVWLKHLTGFAGINYKMPLIILTLAILNYVVWVINCT